MTPAPFAAELDKLSAALGRPFDVPEGQRYQPEGAPARKAYRVRVARANERGRFAVLRGLPAGSKRAESQSAWLRAVRENRDLSRLRCDTFATTMAVAQLLAWTADWRSMTTRPTLAVLVERSGRSQATVGRALRRLRDAGLLGIVAGGRSAEFATAKGGGAEAAVYVLAEPLPPVDEHEHPTASGLACDPPHAGAREANDSSEPLRGAPVAAAARPSAPVEPADGSNGRPATAGLATQRPDERVARARAMQDRVPVLRRISDRHVASLLREFVLAGWTDSELVAAIDRRPDGTKWPHDGADGVGNVGAWLAYRLGAWRDEAGTVRRSPAQLAEAARHERLAQQRAEHERAAAWRPLAPDSPGQLAVRALLDQTRRRNR